MESSAVEFVVVVVAAIFQHFAATTLLAFELRAGRYHLRRCLAFEAVIQPRSEKHRFSFNETKILNDHYRLNQVIFGTNSLKSLGPRIWNSLPEKLKSANSLNIFKSLTTQ